MTEDELELDNMPAADEDADVNAPLITDEDEERENEEYGQTRKQARSTLRNAGKVVWLLTCSAGISGLLFGYDTGVISSTLVSIGTDLSHRPLTTTDKSLITAVTSLFALLAAPTTGYLADTFGRRFVILVACVLFILGAAVQAIAGYVWIMVVGRAAVGSAVGLASCATPLYITELAPAELRGRLVTIQSLFITGGQVIAYFIGWLFSSLNGGWRWMVGLGALPAIVQAVLLVRMYETPRWLVKNAQEDRAQSVLDKIYSGLDEHDRASTTKSVLSDIQDEIATEAKLDSEDTFKATASQLLHHPPNRRALTIACMLQGLQQLCGFNSLMYFSASIFAYAGFVSPIGVSMTVAATNFVFTCAAFAFIDTVGRRNILLYSVPFMIIGLVSCSITFKFMVFHVSGRPGSINWALLHESNMWCDEYCIALKGVLVGSMILYVGAYAIGLGCVPWQQSELFPLRVRSLGSGISTATNWSSNFVIGITFLPMMQVIGPTPTFALYAVICLVGWIGIFRIYPETAGLELEGIGELLKDGFGVKQSVERFRASKKGWWWEGFIGRGGGE